MPSAYCSECGTPLSEAATFCEHCGKRLADTVDATGATPTQPGKATATMRPETARTLGVVSLVLGALAAGIMFVGGCCCGWMAWPLVIAAIVIGFIALGSDDKAADNLAKWGIGLAIIVPIVRFVLWTVILSALNH